MSTYRPRFSPSRRAVLKASGAFAVGLTFLPRFSMAEEEKKLNFYNWDTYIGENTLADFNAATGIEVKMDLYADNAELFAKLKEGNPGYDVIVPTNDYVERMITAGMLEELDHSKIPNMANIADAFKDAAFDPGRKHSLPYMWGTLGHGYRKSKVEDAGSWKASLEGETHSGRIALLGDGESVIGIALKYLGHSFNSVDPAHMKAAEDLLIAGKKNIKTYADDKTVYYFAGIDGARFKRPVEPGDQLVLHAELDRMRSGIFKFKAHAMVGEELAVEAELICTMRTIA